MLASHLAEWAARAEPADRGAQALKRDVYSKRMDGAESFMAQNIFRAAMNEARAALGEEPVVPSGSVSL